ncbi:MAG: transposase [Polyangiaceae bacterium]|nr:transposase [Polyangiaceae bacterium]
MAHGAEKVLEYLGRYVHRTAMSDRALLAMDDRSVTLRYRDSRDRRHKVLTLPADEMLRRFLQHVPPKGMHRVRAFGLLHPAQRQTLRRLQLLLAPRRPGDQEPASDPPPPRARTKCAHCGQPGLTLVLRFEPDLAMSAQLPTTLGSQARAPPRAPPVPAVP